jgi:hypothetical protein
MAVALALAATGACAGSPRPADNAPPTWANSADRASTSAMATWALLKARAHRLDEAQRVRQVNAAFNAYTYRTDQDQDGVEDHWATPFELIERGAGDCEDFAIAKYFMLLESGVDPARVKLAFVYYRAQPPAGEPSLITAGPLRSSGPLRSHVVTLYWPHEGGEPLVLDLIPEVMTLAQRTDLQVVFDFDDAATYVVHAPRVSDGAVRRMMMRWAGVLRRGLFGIEPAAVRVSPRR